MIIDMANASLSSTLWGNKAANLSTLATEGLPVPPALCLQPGAVSGLTNTRFLDHWLSAIKSDRIIVRCSTEIEDTADDAGAGRTLSILNLPPSVDHLIRVISQEIDPELSKYRGGRCCILQEQIQGTLAGVAFKTERSLVLEANYGSSEATTAGETPELRVITEGGVRRWEIAEYNRIHYHHFARQVEQIAQNAYRLLKSPIDIEWVFDGRTTFLLQARPITANVRDEDFPR